MALKLNPITGKLDYFYPAHSAIATYKFLGFTTSADEDPPIDPGVGNMVFNTRGTGLETVYQLIFNRTDKKGFDLGILVSFLYFIMGGYDVWFFLHSTKNPSYWLSGFTEGSDTILDEEGKTIAYIVYYQPLLGSVTYDPETEEYITVLIPDNHEVIVSMDLTAPIFTGGGA